MSFLRINNLQKVFCKDNICVAKEINLSVNKGEIFTLMGKSGSGKSSLLRMICGFETPDAGEIILENTPLFAKDTDKSPQERELSIMFQNYALFPHLNVAQNILLGYETQGKARLDALLKKLEISSIKNRYIHEISGGQQQRVALCRALIRQPKLLLLDEPFSSIDGQLRQMLRIELKQMIEAFGITSIFVTHDKEDAFFMSKRAALMANGEILQTGDIKTLYTKPNSFESAEFLGKINAFLVDEKPLLLRPDAIKITAGGKFAATVTHVTFCGFYNEVSLEFNKQLLTVFTNDSPTPGQTVHFDIAQGVLD
jgi:ABC-type Fe3+/spermidine/putrescine transport system ATPase subunit